MRSLSKTRSLPRWLFGGSILFGLSCFVACSSSEPGDGGDGSGGSGTCSADTSSDRLNCGSCGNACTAVQACVAGTCRLSCAPPQMECSGMCADTSSNSLHCGACGMPAPAGEICQSGACVMGSCPTGETTCNGACVDTQTSLANCGACGMRVPRGPDLHGWNAARAVEPAAAAAAATGGSAAAADRRQHDRRQRRQRQPAAAAAAARPAAAPAARPAAAPAARPAAAAADGGSGGSYDDRRMPRLARHERQRHQPGTEAAPVATLLKAYDLMCPDAAGGAANGAECAGPAPRSICIKSGTYTMTHALRVQEDPHGHREQPHHRPRRSRRLASPRDPSSTSPTQPRLTCGENPDNIGGLTVNAHYVTMKNLVVRNANDTCIQVQGIQGIVENVLTYDCADTGIQISSGDPFTPAARTTSFATAIRTPTTTRSATEKMPTASRSRKAPEPATSSSAAAPGTTRTTATISTPGRRPCASRTAGPSTRAEPPGARAATATGSSSVATVFRPPTPLSALFATGNVNGSNGEGFTRNSNPASMSCSGCASWGNTDNGADGISGLPRHCPERCHRRQHDGRQRPQRGREPEGDHGALGS